MADIKCGFCESVIKAGTLDTAEIEAGIGLTTNLVYCLGCGAVLGVYPGTRGPSEADAQSAVGSKITGGYSRKK